ncbi:MAG TPA: hypothetical protein VEV44_14600 [Pseudoneobacillus sp.]|nr:hypothetical protein [Pseudoneobacillus sp.]
MLENIVFYGILGFIVMIASFLFYKAEQIVNKKLKFVFLSLGLNVSAFPISYFIGGMVTDSPDSNFINFYKGFFFVQGILLILFIISIVFLFVKKEGKYNS